MDSLKILNNTNGKRILIIGDAVADQFLFGTISRVSREAPVFILKHKETETRPGGAANAAANIAALGGIPVMVGLIGNDQNGDLLAESLRMAGASTEHLIRIENLATTTKTRVLAGQQFAVRQQVIRIDYEPDPKIAAAATDKILRKIDEIAPISDAIIVSDYGYGAATPDIFRSARDLARKYSIPITVDSRFRLGEFKGATAATPNLEEAQRLISSGEFPGSVEFPKARDEKGTADFSDFPAELAKRLRDFLETEAMLITLGPAGMLVADSTHEDPVKIDAIGSKEPVDVTGAGDTVIAAFSLALAAGADFTEAAEIANHAGGIVVMKKGTAVVKIDELSASLQKSQGITGISATSER